MRSWLAALCLLSGACVGAEFDAIQITGASLELDMTTIMVALGGTGGEGTLSFTTVDGGVGSCPVTMRGPMLGAAFAIYGGPDTIVLDLPADSVPLSDVFGSYFGGGAGFLLIAGGEARGGTNRNGVSFSDSDGALGMGMYFAMEVLRIAPPSPAECTF